MITKNHIVFHVPVAVPSFVPIHHLPLDAKSLTFYSLPIFDTRLAPLAIPVAVRKRSLRAVDCHLFPYYPDTSPKSFGPVTNPASPDGGQHPN